MRKTASPVSAAASSLALVFLFLYAPIFILIIFSFNAGNSSSVWKGFSLHWYGELFHNRLIMQSVYTTLLVSLLATVIATVAGTFAAIGFHAMRRRSAAHPDDGEQHPHDERGYRHGRFPVPALCGLFRRLAELRRLVQQLAVPRGPAGAG